MILVDPMSPNRETWGAKRLGVERCCGGFGDSLVLLAGTSTDSDSSNDLPASFERNAAGEDHYAAVIGGVDAEELVAAL